MVLSYLLLCWLMDVFSNLDLFLLVPAIGFNCLLCSCLIFLSFFFYMVCMHTPERKGETTSHVEWSCYSHFSSISLIFWEFELTHRCLGWLSDHVWDLNCKMDFAASEHLNHQAIGSGSQLCNLLTLQDFQKT